MAVTEVDEEINQAVATLRRLIAKRCDLLSEHNRAHGTLMQQLPVELKNHVFEHLLPSRDEWGVIPRTEKTAMRSYMDSISVCKGWRNVALSNPSLWSTMHITLGISDSSSQVNDWVLRSGTLPLTLHIQVTDHNDQEWSRRVLASILDALSRCSNRLQSLSLDIPFSVLCSFQRNNFQYHRLTQLRIISQSHQFDQHLSLLNQTASLEKIELRRVSFQPFQISWNHLTSAKFVFLDLEDLTQLFEHASQMAFCEISSLRRCPVNFSVPPIIHHRLKILKFRHVLDWDVVPMLFGSLTLPCLQELDTDETVLLIHLPALVHRSSCPLTKLTLTHYFEDQLVFDELQPLPGVTDLVVGALDVEPEVIKRLLLEGYFPDLRHLTLRSQVFLNLWEMGVIPLLLDRKRRRPGGPNEGRLDKFLVEYEDQDADFDHIWELLMKLGISLREDGFEFL